jgi:putative lipoprotein
MRLIHTVAVASLICSAGFAVSQTPLEISGTATYRERIMLPKDVVFEATLEDVSLADAKSRVIATTRNEQPGNPPFNFKIAYDPAKIVTNHDYAVRARITVNAKLLFTTDQRYSVLTKGHGSEIAMMLLKRVTVNSSTTGAPAAAKRSAADEPLRETYWKLIALDGKPVAASEHQREANLIFHTDNNRISGSGGCNRLMGGYLVEGSSLHFQGVASTRMACPSGMDTEQAFLKALDKVESWKIACDELSLLGSGDAVLARFKATALK